MARLNRKGELWSHLTSVKLIRKMASGGGDTTLAAAMAVAATSLTLTSGTNFTTGDPIIVGNGEVSEYFSTTSVAGTAVTGLPAPGALFAHNAGEAVYEVELTDLGHISGEVSVEYGGSPDPVPVATKRLMLGYLSGHMDIAVRFAVAGFNPENLAALLGMLESRVISGTVAIDLERIKEVNDLAIQFTGARKDGGTVRVTAMGVELDLNALSVTLRRGQLAALPFIGHVTATVLYEQFN